MHKLYPSQQPGEKIMLVVRESLFLLFVKFFLVLILIIAPSLIKLLFNILSIDFQISQEWSVILTLATQLYYLATLLALFLVFVLYYLNMNVVSDQRIVDIDQKGLLFREVSELNIESIEDVTTEIDGLFGNIFNYGTVFIQTAGTTERFEFENIPNPAKVSSLILKLYEAHGVQKK
ncbi:MAG: PH domain-containing protein [Candidatus Doudnabacteria bacterium]